MNSSDTRRKGVLNLIALCLFGAVLSACSGVGPQEPAVLHAARQSDASFALVDVDSTVLDVLAAVPRPSFKAVFGDYRGPSIQRVRPGDTVQVNVWETGTGGLYSTPQVDRVMGQASNVSTIPEQVVARDGTINVPYAGRIKVSGLTAQQIEGEIVERLTDKTSDPQVMVAVTKNMSYTATVTGDGSAGGLIPLNGDGDRLLSVVATAGGIRIPIQEAAISVSRDGRSIIMPMQDLLSNPKENVYIRPGDIITVYRSPWTFTAYGATGRNQVVDFDTQGIFLDEAIGRAGGLLDNRADLNGVFILRLEPSNVASQLPGVPEHLLTRSVVPIAYRLNMSRADALFRARQFAVRDKDILYVSNAATVEVEKVLRLFQLTASPVLQIVD